MVGASQRESPRHIHRGESQQGATWPAKRPAAKQEIGKRESRAGTMPVHGVIPERASSAPRKTDRGKALVRVQGFVCRSVCAGFSKAFVCKGFCTDKASPNSISNFGENRNAEPHAHTETFGTKKLVHEKVFTHRSFDIDVPVYTGADAFTQRKLVRTDAFPHRRFLWMLLRTFLAKKDCLHAKALTVRRLCAFTHRSFYTQQLLHMGDLTHKSFIHGCLDMTTRHFCTQELFHRHAFTHKKVSARKCFHFAKENRGCTSASGDRRACEGFFGHKLRTH